MRAKTPRHYAHLLATQKLLQKRDEAELASLKRDLTHLEQENSLLGAMMARGSYADLVDPLLISQRMERNRRSQSQLTSAIEAQIKTWLQSNRRVDKFEQKQAQAQAEQDRAELSDFLGEIIAQSLFSPSQ